MIEARQVSVRFGHDLAPAVAGVDLDLAPGERVILAGRSGAGKSSLALALAGLVAPDAGTVTVDGLPASSRRERGEVAARVGLLFQSPGTQLLTMRVADEIALGLENLGWPPGRIAARVAAVLDLLGLGRLALRSPRTLSGGEMQRVALGAAIAPGPRYLLLDEPTAHLDPQAAAEVEAAIEAEAARAGALRLDLAPLVSPARGTAAGRRTVVLERGRVVHDGPGPLPPAVAGHLLGAEGPARPEPLGALGPEPAGCRLRARGLEAGWPGGPAVVAAHDLDLEPGTVTALSGPSGAGKSTLLLTLAGLLPPRSGTVEVIPQGAIRERVSCVFQLAERLFYRPTVAEELLDYGVSREVLPAAVDLVGLSAAVLARAPLRLSGGELRRVALAAGVAARRPVLLLDEPGVGLDGPGRRALAHLVRSCAAAGSTVLLAAHDPEILALAGRRLTLAGGRLAETRVEAGTRT